MTWNSTFTKPSKPLQRKTAMHQAKPMARSREKRGPGLAQRITESLGRAIQHARGESNLLRSEQHRMNVAALPCACCGRPGPSQCAHANFGKGMGIKACDSQTFPLCPECHRHHDQGGLPKRERIRREVIYVDATRAELISRSLWSATIEEAYRRAYEPMKRAAA